MARKADPNQYLLPFGTHKERYSLLDAINHSAVAGALNVDGKPITRAGWTSLRKLLKVYNTLDRGDGCWASVQTIADECEWAASTASKWIRVAEEHDLLDLVPRGRRDRNGGRAPNLAHVRWDRVAALGPRRGVDSESAEVDSECRGVDSEIRSAIKENSELSPSRRDESSATENICSATALTSRQLGAARQRLREIIRTLGQPRQRDDYELARKAVVLSFTRYSEHWLIDSLEAVRKRSSRPKRPWGYWHRVLQESVRDLTGRELRVDLAKTNPPTALTPADDLSERLCATRDPED